MSTNTFLIPNDFNIKNREHVSLLQQSLVALGYCIDLKEIRCRKYQITTKEAVQSFQKDSCICASARIISSETISAINAETKNVYRICGYVTNNYGFPIEGVDVIVAYPSDSSTRNSDMAREMMSLTQSNVLQQASTAMLAQANQAPQGEDGSSGFRINTAADDAAGLAIAENNSQVRGLCPNQNFISYPYVTTQVDGAFCAFLNIPECLLNKRGALKNPIAVDVLFVQEGEIIHRHHSLIIQDIETVVTFPLEGVKITVESVYQNIIDVLA